MTKETDLDLLAALGGDTSLDLESAESQIDISCHDDIDNELQLSPLEKRALSLLGSGCNNEIVASALGVTPSTISTLLAQQYFRDKVTELRFKSLHKHTERDDKYDHIEDRLLTKLENSIQLMITPKTILEAVKVVNAAKRRGASNPQNIATQAQVTQLYLPNAIIQNFTVNANNQVIQAGNQTLITMESKNLDVMLEAKRTEELRKSLPIEQFGGNTHGIQRTNQEGD